jgi:predicted phosphoribosyltransferase
MFKDRTDAGLKLASRPEKYRDKGVFVLAIPRGGTRVGDPGTTEKEGTE